jgi:pyruvate dehydrogenase E1 component beta subunit
MPAEKLFYREGIVLALREAMAADRRVFVMGQDAGAFGGAYREFDGLHAAFGAERVRDTPVAEAAMLGIGLGAAAAGMRPVVSVTYMDFLMLALDPLVNYGAKLRFKTAGRLTAPIVVMVTAGAKGQGVAHSQCIEAWLMGVPGLKIVAPATPQDAYGLMRAAIADDGPVLFATHKKLFPVAGDVTGARVPIGAANIIRAGTDVTLVTHSYLTRVARDAAELLIHEGISCEIIDLRSLCPLDIGLVAASAARTGRLLTLEEGQLACGVGAEIAARVQAVTGPLPVHRVGPRAAPVSSNPVLEAACIPDATRVAAETRRFVLNGKCGGWRNDLQAGRAGIVG